jgi:hypothetical protein
MRRAEANWAGAPRAPVMGTSRERSLLRSLGAFSEWTIRSEFTNDRCLWRGVPCPAALSPRITSEAESVKSYATLRRA